MSTQKRVLKGGSQSNSHPIAGFRKHLRIWYIFFSHLTRPSFVCSKPKMIKICCLDPVSVFRSLSDGKPRVVILRNFPRKLNPILIWCSLSHFHRQKSHSQHKKSNSQSKNKQIPVPFYPFETLSEQQSIAMPSLFSLLCDIKHVNMWFFYDSLSENYQKYPDLCYTLFC